MPCCPFGTGNACKMGKGTPESGTSTHYSKKDSEHGAAIEGGIPHNEARGKPEGSSIGGVGDDVSGAESEGHIQILDKASLSSVLQHFLVSLQVIRNIPNSLIKRMYRVISCLSAFSEWIVLIELNVSSAMAPAAAYFSCSTCVLVAVTRPIQAPVTAMAGVNRA